MAEAGTDVNEAGLRGSPLSKLASDLQPVTDGRIPRSLVMLLLGELEKRRLLRLDDPDRRVRPEEVMSALEAAGLNVTRS